jgi:hypothetical protein
MTIRGERRFERTDDSEKQHGVVLWQFRRSFAARVPTNRRSTRVHDGVLKVRSEDEAQKPKPIEIQVKQPARAGTQGAAELVFFNYRRYRGTSVIL